MQPGAHHHAGQLTRQLNKQHHADARMMEQKDKDSGFANRQRGNMAFAQAFGQQPPDGYRADGGPVEAGKSYVVNEEGSEGFQPEQGGAVQRIDGAQQSIIPREDGTIIPAKEMKHKRSALNRIKGRKPAKQRVKSYVRGHSNHVDEADLKKVGPKLRQKAINK